MKKIVVTVSNTGWYPTTTQHIDIITSNQKILDEKLDRLLKISCNIIDMLEKKA